jgi:hypothetical protein
MNERPAGSAGRGVGQRISPYSTIVPWLAVQMTRVVLRGIGLGRRAGVVVRKRDTADVGRGEWRFVVVTVISALLRLC